MPPPLDLGVFDQSSAVVCGCTYFWGWLVGAGYLSDRACWFRHLASLWEGSLLVGGPLDILRRGLLTSPRLIFRPFSRSHLFPVPASPWLALPQREDIQGRCFSTPPLRAL